MNKAAVLGATALLILASGAARADRGGPASVISARGPGGGSSESLAPVGAYDSILTINMGGRESWDAWNSPNNELLTEILGAGAAVTGLGFRQVVISTVPDTGSWRWDAVTAFSSSHADSYIIELAPGAGDGPGTGTYDSGGILLLQDVPEPFGPLPPLPVGDDGQLFIQLFEDPDDLENAIDANYTAGSYDVAYIAGAPVPAASSAFLLGLALTLTLVGIWRISTTRRRGSATPEI